MNLISQANFEKKILEKLYDLAWETCDLDLYDALELSQERYSKILSELKLLEPELVSSFAKKVREEVEWLKQKIELGLEIAPYEGLREDIKRFGKLQIQLQAVEEVL